MRYIASIIIPVLILIQPFNLQGQSPIEKLKSYSHFLESQTPYFFNFCQIIPTIPDSICGLLIYGGEKRFLIQLPDEEILFDGKYLWSYSQVNNQTVVEEYDISLLTLIPSAFFTGDWSGYSVEEDNRLGEDRFLIRTEDISVYQAIIMTFSQDSIELISVDYLEINNNHIRFIVNESGRYKKPIDFIYHKRGNEEIIDLRSE